MTELKRHKHASVAEAFGNRKKIQYRSPILGEWFDYTHKDYPRFQEESEWRVAPDEPEALYQWRVKLGRWFIPDRLFADSESVLRDFPTAEEIIRIDASRWVPPQEDEK